MRQLYLAIERRLQLLILLLGVLAFSLCIWVGGTHLGTQWLFDRLDNRLPNTVTISGVSGTLFDRLEFEHLQLVSPVADIDIESGILDWKLSYLLSRKFQLDTIIADKVTVSLKTKAKTQKSTKPPSLPSAQAPLDIQIQDLLVGELLIRKGGKQLTKLSDIKLRANWSGDNVYVDQLELKQGEFLANGKGVVSLNETRETDLNLTIQRQNTQGQLNAKLKGPLQSYQWTISSDLQIEELPPLGFFAEGQGNLERVEIEHSQLNPTEGSLKAEGELQWWPTLAGSLVFVGENLNPATLQPKLPGSISLEGQLAYKENTVDLQIEGSGTLREQPITFLSNGEYHENTLTLHNLKFQAADNHLSLEGLVTKEQSINLTYQIQAPTLSKLHPDLSGEVTGSGHISGTLDQANILASLDAKSLQWRDIKLGKFNLDIAPQEDSVHSVSLTAEKISSAQLELNQIKISGTASPHSQTLSIQASTKKSDRLSTHIDSRYESKLNRFSGIVRDTLLKSSKLQPFKQREDSVFSVSPNVQSLQNLCLFNEKEQVCADFKLDTKNTSNATVKAESFPLSNLTSLLPEASVLKEKLDLDIRATRVDKSWQIHSTASLDEQNTLKSNLEISDTEKSLRGYIAFDFSNLHWLALLAPSISQPKGQLSADIKMGGSLGSPTIAGSAALRKGQLKLPSSGTEISKINLEVNFESLQSATLSGDLNVGGSPLTLQGKSRWASREEFDLSINAKGEHLLAMNTHEATVYFSPNLTFHALPGKLLLTGSLQIPEAEITPGEIPVTAASVSKDEHIISSKTKTNESKPLPPLHMNITVDVGNQKKQQKVVFDGFGLKTHLEGKIHITQLPGKPLLGDGNIKMLDGFYKAYGQDLDIEKGEIYFNGPLDNPGYSIQAVRESGKVRAGIRINGTLDSPESTLFSEPALSDTDTLSYLLTGQPFDRENTGNTGSNPVLLLAATRWGLKRGGGVIEDLQETTGIDTLRLSTEDDVNQSALLIGKYLTPKLYIQYAMKLFEETDLFSLSYELSPTLVLEAESGTSQGLNLIYRLERD